MGVSRLPCRAPISKDKSKWLASGQVSNIEEDRGTAAVVVTPNLSGRTSLILSMLQLRVSSWGHLPPHKLCRSDFPLPDTFSRLIFTVNS